MAKGRFEETVNIQPQTISTGEPQQLLGLAGKLDQFASFTANIAAEQTIEKASIEGQAAGLAQQQAGVPLELKEETFIGGIGKKAFNTAAREGYLKSLDNDNIESITTIATENPKDLTAFNDAVNGYAKGVMDNVDPASKAAVALSIDSMVSRFRPRIQAAQAQQVVDDANNDQAINATERSRLAQASSFEGDTEQAGLNLAASIDSISNRTDLSDEQKSIAIRNVQLQEREASFSGELSRTFDSEGAEAAFKQLEAMSKKPAGGFTPDEWSTFIGGATADLNRAITIKKAANAQQDIETERQISNLKISAGTGIDPATGRDILPSQVITETEQLFNAGQITESERTGIVKNIINREKEKRKDIDELNKIIRRTTGVQGEVLDPTAVNKYYEEVILPDTQNIDPISSNAIKANYVDQVKMMPPELRAEVDTQLLSGDPDLAVQAADLIDRVDQVPGLEDPFSPNQRAFAGWIVKLSKNMAPQEAVKKAEELTDPRDKARIEARQLEFNELVKKDKFDFAVDDLVERGFFNLNVPPSAVNSSIMQTEYKDLVQSHFLSGMSINDAEGKAAQLLKRNWKDQEFLGRHEAFKYPLSDFYAVDGSVDYAEKQLMGDIKREMVFADPVTEENVFLLSDRRTAEEAAFGQPSYLIYIVQDGEIKQTGQRFKPDVNEAITARDERLQGLRNVTP